MEIKQLLGQLQLRPPSPLAPEGGIYNLRLIIV